MRRAMVVAALVLAAVVGAEAAHVSQLHLRGELEHEAEHLLDTMTSGKKSGNFFWDNKGIISLSALIILSTILSVGFKQTPGNGVPETDDALEDATMWTNHEKMATLAKDRVETQQKMSVNFWHLFMNKPWYTEVVEYKWGGEEELSPVDGWMGKKPWPAGETNTEDAWAMIKAYWSFMMDWKGEGARTCIIISILQGLIGPVAAQMFCWILDEIGTGQTRSTSGPLANVPGTAEEILALWCVILLAWYSFSIYLVWLYEMEVPEGGVVRQFKLRLQSQFVAFKGDKATAWPAGRCAGVLVFDVGQLIGGIWIAVFQLANYGTSLVLIVVVTLWNNRTVVDTLFSWCVFFAILLTGSIIDIMSRRENLKDLAERKRDWICVESAMATAQVRMSRDGKDTKTLENAAKDYEDASFMSWYRGAHSFLFGLAAQKACAGLNYAALGMITYVAGLNVMRGDMSMGQATALMICLQMMAGVQSSFVGTLCGLYQAYPSLRSVAEILNEPTK